MNRKQQPIQLELNFPEAAQSALGASTGEELELSKSAHDTEPRESTKLMDEICQPANLELAMRKVMANRGSPGVDGMHVRRLPGLLRQHGDRICRELRDGSYRPAPVKRVEIRKNSGGLRQLGIPTVLDRLIQQATAQVLGELWDPTFSDHSYGFRPGRNAHQAVNRAQEYVREGYTWVVDIDLERFFDQVNHDRLMGAIAKRVSDRSVLKLVRGFLRAGVMQDGLVRANESGTPQGGPLSPLLSNIVLDELDRELERRKHRFVRYADDCNLFVRTERAGQRVMASVSGFISKRMKLQVNSNKSAVDRPWRRSFLSFTMTEEDDPKRAIAPPALKRFRKRVRALTSRQRGIRLKRMIRELSTYLRGWRAYFGHCETPDVFGSLDGWIRRRLRQAVWVQWKTPRRREEMLKRLGAKPARARAQAGAGQGSWSISRHYTLQAAVNNRTLSKLGLFSLDQPTL